MSLQRMVNTKFWDDSYIIKLDPIEKLLFLYLLTNPLTNISGIYEVSLRRVAFDSGIDSEMVGRILKRFEKDKKVVYKNGWIWLVNFVKNQNLNPSIKVGIKSILDDVPQQVHNTLGTGWVQGGTQWGEYNLNIIKEEEKGFSLKNKKRPYYNGEEMRFSKGKWWVIPKVGGEWLLFAGKQSEITWK